MVLMERDGITVQAIGPQEEAEYKRLGFTKVKEAPAKKEVAKEAKPKDDK